MKVALDPYMLRGLPLRAMLRQVAELGFGHIELSPRPDFLPFYLHPRASRARIDELNAARRETGVAVSAILIGDYQWANEDEDQRVAAVRYWRRAIEISAAIDCRIMAAELGGRPEIPRVGEAAFWRSLEELLPLFERERITLTLEAHPYNFIEDNTAAVDLIHGIDSPWVRYLYCAPHTFYLGTDLAAMLRYAAPVLAHVHVADTFNPRGSSGARYIVNPHGSNARIHQHLNIGEGEVDWDAFFATLAEVGFDGLLTSSVFAWEERAIESSTLMRDRIGEYIARYFPPAPGVTRSGRRTLPLTK